MPKRGGLVLSSFCGAGFAFAGAGFGPGEVELVSQAARRDAAARMARTGFSLMVGYMDYSGWFVWKNRLTASRVALHRTGSGSCPAALESWRDAETHVAPRAMNHQSEGTPAIGGDEIHRPAKWQEEFSERRKKSPRMEDRRHRLSGQTGLRPVRTAGDGCLPGQPGRLSSALEPERELCGEGVGEAWDVCGAAFEAILEFELGVSGEAIA